MRRILSLAAIAAVTAAAGPAGRLHAQAASGRAALYAIENATLVPMTGDRSLLPRHTVIVRDGEVAAVGPVEDVAIPAGATVIPGDGRFVTPGLAEMVARLPAEDDPLRVVVLDEILHLFLANGITTIRAVDGSPYLLELRESIAAGEVLGPRLFVGSPALGSVSAGAPAAAAALAREYAAAGYDFLTMGEGSTPEVWAAAAAVARELDISLDGGLPAGAPTAAALEAVSSVHPLPIELGGLADRAAQSGVYVVPAQYLAHHQYGWNHLLGGWVSASEVVELEEMGYVPQKIREDWRAEAWNLWDAPEINPESAGAFVERRRALVAALHEAGVRFLMGSDAQRLFNVPGFALHRELPLLVEAGLSPHEVLASGTSMVARYVREELGQPAKFGAVAPGLDADLLLLDANPLDSVDTLAKPAGVMVRGRWLAREELETELESIAERHKDYDPD